MAEVAFGLIGPLDIRCAGQPVPVSAARQRNLLAALLLRVNQPVSRQRLCAAVWGDHATQDSETTLRSYVMRLRRTLGPRIAARLSAQPSGYQLRLEEDDEFDLLRLQACISQGKLAARAADWDRSMHEFRAAQSLWRGEPLCDVPSGYLRLSFIPVLTELRVQLWEGLYEAARHRRQVADLLVPLQRRTEDDPLNERYSVLFMSALASCNRRTDALAEYRRLRAALIGEYGVEPGLAAREFHQELLRDEPGQALAEPPAPGRRPRTQSPRQLTPGPGLGLVPRQLPRGTRVFAGRRHEIDDLVQYLTGTPGRRAAPPVAAITGFPGIGKSELALTVAHRVAGHFPDGQLHADLRGSTDEPVAPGRILARFLRALGLDHRSIARNPAERVGQFRSLMAARRVLLLLDDTADAEHVRSLIPGSPSCATLVTGRRGLSRLAEARLTTLGGLTGDEAGDLLRALGGPDRIARQPAALAAIVAACDGVPLALSVVGARLAARPAWSLGQVAGMLADERTLRAELAPVRDALAIAYRQLGRRDPDAAAIFGLLGERRFPAVNQAIGVAEAAALSGLPTAGAMAALEALTDANLLCSPAPGSYLLPGLAGLFAAECARTRKSPP